MNRHHAARTLLAALTAEGRAVRATDAIHAGADLGLSERTIRRAARELGLATRRVGFGPGAAWWWATRADDLTGVDMDG